MPNVGELIDPPEAVRLHLIDIGVADEYETKVIPAPKEIKKKTKAKKTIGICASGPSITKEDCKTLKENCEEIIAVNDTWRMVDADHLYAADFHWWKYHIADVARDFEGKCWSCDPPGNTNWGKNNPEAWGVHKLRCRIRERGLSKDPEYVHSGSNSGYQAINLALHLGATRIVLLGFDMHCHGGKSHWFGDHPEKFRTDTNFGSLVESFRTIKPEQYGIEILNCSRKTALDAFPVHSLEDIF